MKSYNHKATISLRKPTLEFISKVDNAVVNSDDVCWIHDPVTNAKVTVVNGRVYSRDVFNESFTEYISRQNELLRLTQAQQRATDAARVVSNAHEEPRLITYDVVSSPGFDGAMVGDYVQRRNANGDIIISIIT